MYGVNLYVGFLGAGGQANEVESYLSSRKVSFRAVDHEYIQRGMNMIDINKPKRSQINTEVVAVVGSPAIRKELIERWLGNKYATIISKHAMIDKTSKISQGTVICPGVVITTNVQVGSHTIINLSSSISHDSRVGNYVTISPGVHVGGRVNMGDGSFIGIGAIIKNNINIAKGVVIGAGAVLVSDASVENGVYHGVPAKLKYVNDEWLRHI